MSFTKSLLVAALFCVSAVASAQQGRPANAHPTVPCRLKPAIYTNVQGVNDYGVTLIIGNQEFRGGPMSFAAGANLYAQTLKKGSCVPPKNLLICNVVPVGAFRHGIQFSFQPSKNFPQGHTAPTLVNDVGASDPYQILSYYRRAQICQ